MLAPEGLRRGRKIVAGETLSITVPITVRRSGSTISTEAGKIAEPHRIIRPRIFLSGVPIVPGSGAQGNELADRQYSRERYGRGQSGRDPPLRRLRRPVTGLAPSTTSSAGCHPIYFGPKGNQALELFAAFGFRR
jgi:hypothetical protein